jgi:hypothetical protein
MTDVVRPATVPQGARFDDGDEIWILESKDARGVLEGMTRRWRSSGALIEEITYADGKPVLERHYHPDGTLGFERQYDPKTHFPRYQTRYASAGETDLRFPRGGLAPEVMRARYDYDPHGYLVEFTGWDAQGKVVAQEAPRRSLDGRTEQTTYASFEEASREWNEKGRAYYAALNHFVAEINKPEPPDDLECPDDERGHMEMYVLHAIERLNREGRVAEIRRLFEPSFEPICGAVWGNLGKRVHKVGVLPDRIVVNAGDEVYSIVGDEVAREEAMIRFGLSKNRAFMALCYDDRIDVVDIAAHKVVRTFAPPTAPGVPAGLLALEVTTVLVSGDGLFVILGGPRGIFVLRPDRAAVMLLPNEQHLQDEDVKEHLARTGKLPDLEQAQAAIREDDRVVVVSGQFESYRPQRTSYAVDAQLGFTNAQDDVHEGGFLPSHYHSDGQSYLLGVGNGDESMILTLSREFVDAQEDKLLENYEGSFSARSATLGAVWELGSEFVIGMSDCYVWRQAVNQNTQDFVYVGCGGEVGDVTSIDVTPDGRELIVGTNFGAVWRLGLNGPSRPTGFLTNMKVVDLRRYLFLQSFQPLVW